jgi:hypothetical protein
LVRRHFHGNRKSEAPWITSQLECALAVSKTISN